jgi:hypothetical protein
MRHVRFDSIRVAVTTLVLLGAFHVAVQAQVPGAQSHEQQMHAQMTELHMRIMGDTTIHRLIMADTAMKRLMHSMMDQMSPAEQDNMHAMMEKNMSPEEVAKMKKMMKDEHSEHHHD